MKSASFDKVIEGTQTAIHISLYQNRALVIISQTESFGSIMHTRCETGFQQLPTIDVSVVLGQRDNAASLACAQSLTSELIKVGCTKPVVICLGLKNQTLPTVTAAINAVKEHKIWQTGRS